VAQFRDGKFDGWRAPRADEPAGTHRISVELKQNAHDAGFMATIENYGPSRLKVEMGLMRIDGPDEPEYTSSCPLEPGRSLFESWPYPLFQLLLASPRILAEDEQVPCE
jgi:hypothetical protein